jgi:hypothetical protein
LNIPIINVAWNITCYMNQSNGAAGTGIFPPLQTSANVAEITGGLDATPTPAIFYGMQQGGGRGTRLYYRSVKFSPADNARSVFTHSHMHNQYLAIPVLSKQQLLALHQYSCNIHKNVRYHYFLESIPAIDLPHEDKHASLLIRSYAGYGWYSVVR